MHILGRPALAPEIDLVDRPAGVGDDEDLIAEIAGVARRRLDRIRRQHAANDQRRRAELVEQAFEAGADEGAVGMSCRSPFRRRAARRKA